MRVWISLIGFLLLCAGSASAESTLVKGRKTHETKLVKKEREEEKLPEPPPSLFRVVEYESPAGKLAAYLSVKGESDEKRPAIIWITGGFPAGGGGSYLWERPDFANDQSAQAFRNAGMVMMYPTFRGANGNPGLQESFYGEVDDALAALEYLKTVDYVDPKRIYLGGHSTGGTMALLIAASTDQFAAVFSFGPTSDPADYGADSLTYDPTDVTEAWLRAPINYLDEIRSETYVIEGISGNSSSLRALRAADEDSKIVFSTVKNANHFDVLYPINRAFARAIVDGESGKPLGFTSERIQKVFDEHRRAQREAQDFRDLATARENGVAIEKKQTLSFYLFSWDSTTIELVRKRTKTLGFGNPAIEPMEARDGRKYFRLIVQKELVPRDLDAVFEASRQLSEIDVGEFDYSGWLVDGAQ